MKTNQYTIKSGERLHDKYGDSFVQWQVLSLSREDAEKQIEAEWSFCGHSCNHEHDCCGCLLNSPAWISKSAFGKTLITQSFYRNV